MSIITDETWAWFKTAPLPVVLALTILLAGWVWAVDGKVNTVSARATVNTSKVDDTKERLKRIEDKVDSLLSSVAALQSKVQ